MSEHQELLAELRAIRAALERLAPAAHSVAPGHVVKRLHDAISASLAKGKAEPNETSAH